MDPQPQPQQPYRAKWGTNNKGGRVLIDEKGFSYLILRAAKDNMQRSYWKCKDRIKYGCKATACLKEENEEILTTTEHNHSRNLIKELVQKVEKKKIQEAGQMPTVAPR